MIQYLRMIENNEKLNLAWHHDVDDNTIQAITTPRCNEHRSY